MSADSGNTKSTGSCLCGKITFAVSQFQPTIGHCHCSMCQKFHGAAFSTFGEVKLEHISWLTGAELLTSYTAQNHTVRRFCQCCGSSLVFESQYNRDAGTIEIALAAFDQLVALQPDAHIYTESKVDWLTIHDGIAQFKAYRE